MACVRVPSAQPRDVENTNRLADARRSDEGQDQRLLRARIEQVLWVGQASGERRWAPHVEQVAAHGVHGLLLLRRRLLGKAMQGSGGDSCEGW